MRQWIIDNARTDRTCGCRSHSNGVVFRISKEACRASAPETIASMTHMERCRRISPAVLQPIVSMFLAMSLMLASAAAQDAGLAGASGPEVDLALVLAIDDSGSMNDARWHLQLQGYAAAFRQPEFAAAVRAGRLGRIAVTLVEWSGSRRQSQTVGWTLIDSAETAREFARQISAPRPRSRPDWTSVSGAIDYAAALLRTSGYRAARRVIDVSGDGSNNDGRAVNAARDDAVAAGITINGLPILGAEAAVDAYYRDNVIGGRGAFLVVARDERSFGRAVLDKLLTEVVGRPDGADTTACADAVRSGSGSSRGRLD